MNKAFKWFLIVGGFIVTLWIIARLTNALQFFTAPTTSNYPTIKSGDLFFASNLIQPDRFDFICYRMETPELGNQIWIHRLCAIENDKVEIRNGNLYINDKSVDETLSLSHNYFLTETELNKVKKFEKIDEMLLQQLSADTVITYLSDQLVKQKSIKAERVIVHKDYRDEYISQQYGAEWNQDNFGPIVVPFGKYFVMGDNRHSSQDSRYNGFIDKHKYVATVIGKK